MYITCNFLGGVECGKGITQSNNPVAIRTCAHGRECMQGRRCQKGCPHSVLSNIGIIICMQNSHHIVEFGLPSQLNCFHHNLIIVKAVAGIIVTLDVIVRVLNHSHPIQVFRFFEDTYMRILRRNKCTNIFSRKDTRKAWIVCGLIKQNIETCFPFWGK